MLTTQAARIRRHHLAASGIFALLGAGAGVLYLLATRGIVQPGRESGDPWAAWIGSVVSSWTRIERYPATVDEATMAWLRPMLWLFVIVLGAAACVVIMLVLSHSRNGGRTNR